MTVLQVLRKATMVYFPVVALGLPACSDAPASVSGAGTTVPTFAAPFKPAPANASKGVYVAGRDTSTIYAYPGENPKNKPPICSFSSGNNGVITTYDVSSDLHGNLIVPTHMGAILFAGPGMCGAQLGTISSPYGTPVDAFSTDAVNGTIYLAALFGPSSGGPSVAVCTFSDGCTKELTNPYLNSNGAGVVADSKGNVYFTGGNGDGQAVMVEFPGGAAPGVLMNFVNQSAGGLDIDTHGNIIAFDPGASAVYVYSGCPSNCIAHGPFPLAGPSIYGKVNRKGTQLQAADYATNQVDVYAYHGKKGVTYAYSYSNGIPHSGYELSGLARNPLAE